MSEWQEATLGEIAEVQTGPFGSQLKNEQYVVGGTPVVTVEHISNFRIKDFDYPSVTIEDKNRLSRYLLKEGDIIFTRVGSVDLSAYVQSHQNDWMFSSRMLRVRPDKRVDSRFLSYYFQQKSFRDYILNISVGATMPSINTGILKGIRVAYPDKAEQKAIASVLSSLDDKIDLLHRQNTTLERMSKTLFRQWFVEEVQEDWEQGTLESLIETANTGLDAIQRAPIVDYETGIKCLRIQDITQNKKYGNWGNSKVLDKDFEKARLKKDDLIMARTCSPGVIYLAREDMSAVFNNGLARIRPNKNKTYSIFLFYLFKTEDFIGHIYGISGGTSVQLNMKLGDLLSYKVAFPFKETQDKYYPYFESLDNKIFKNQQQIQILEKLRDNLLPKLMSGEVRINN